MRIQTFARTVLPLILLTLVVSGFAGFPARPAAAPNVLRARAEILGAPGSGIEGRIEFTQAVVDADAPLPGVMVVAHVSGLTPGAHGIHIHEVANCSDTTTAFGAAGGHFDPGPFGSSTPVDVNHPFHMGDLPNLIANEAGIGRLNGQTNRITLSNGPLSVFDANGSAVVVHLNPDQGMPGIPAASGGPRIACGVIELDN